MADDIILTEEEQVERIKQWWKKNGPSIALGIFAGLGLVFGYQYWQDGKQQAAEQASASYYELSAAKTPPTAAQFAEASLQFKSDYKDTPYAAKAVLLNAKALAEAENYSAAADELRWVMNNGTEKVSQHIARLRLATILIEQENYSEANTVLATNEKNGFDSQYAELQGDVARLEEDYTKARTYYQAALNDAENSPYKAILQMRVNQMTSLLGGGSAATSN